VLPAISLALATTVIGYLTLLLAPFPGLHQVAAFSVVGLTASFLTVVFWAPFFDERAPLRHGGWLLAGAEGLWRFWHEPRCVRVRWSLAGGLGLTTVLGLAHLAIDDDVRRLQPLSPALKQQELAIQRLTGVRPGGQFLLVQAATTEAALQIEEALLPRLEVARRGGALASYQALAQFIPSAQRQRENRALVRDRLVRPFLAAYYDQLGMAGGAGAVNGESRVLEPADLAAEPALWFLGNLVVPMESAGATHLVLLTGVERPAELRQLGAELPGVRFIDPTGDVTRLLGEYRLRAVALLGLSVLFMLPVLAWRYGVAGSLRVAFPSLAAVLLAPAATSLLGVTFTFFNAMALVMVLSIGIDYAIFCREAAASRRAVTLLGVGLAMLTALLSFGLLALSRTVAVEAFGLTMLFGISIAFALAPLAAASAEPVQDQPGRIA
jgi:predicted exporter